MNDIQPSTFRDGGCRQQLDLWIGSAGARRLLLLVLMRRAEPPRYLCTEYPSRIAAAPLAHLHAPPAMDQANGLTVLYFGLTVRPDTTPSSLVEPLHRRRRPVSAPSPALGPSSFYGRQIESALDSGDLRGQVASSPSRCRSRTGSQLGFDSTSSGQGQQRVTKLSCFGRNMLAATLWSVVSCRGRDAACVHSTQYVRTLLGGHAHCNMQVASQQPPKPPKCCPFSRLILGARGEAPWACACAPYPLLPHPPPSPGRLAPKPYHSPVCLLGRRTAWTRGGDHFHTLILTPAAFFTRPFCSAATLPLGRYSGFFCDLQISRAFPLSLVGRSIRQTSRRLASSSSPVVNLAPRTQSQLDAGRTSPRLFLLHGATSPPPPLLVSAQQPSGLHNLPDTNQLLISLRPTQILSLINAVPKGAPNAPRPRERECPWPCSIFSRRRSPRTSTCLESCLHPSCTLPSPSGTRPGRLIVSGSSDTTTPLAGVVSRQARTPAPISCVGAF